MPVISEEVKISLKVDLKLYYLSDREMYIGCLLNLYGLYPVSNTEVMYY